MKKELICGKDSCTGCALCADSCPAKAISMIYDCEGFYYPQVNYDLCIDCGLCKCVCSANTPSVFNEQKSGYYLCWSKDKIQHFAFEIGGSA